MRNRSDHRQTAIEYNNKGIKLQQSGDFLGAIPYFSRAIQLDPNVPLFWINRGDCFVKEGNLKEALANFDQAIELDPQIQWRFERGIMLVRRARQLEEMIPSDLHQAIEDLSDAAQFPDYPLAYYWCGAAYFYLGDTRQALNEYEQARKVTPDLPLLYWGLGDAYDKLDRYPEAIAAYDRAIELDPHPFFFQLRADSRRHSGDCHGAIRDYTRALDIEPNNDDILFGRACTYEQLGDYVSAYRDLTSAIESNPAECYNLWKRADVLFALGKMVQATNDLKNAVRVAASSRRKYPVRIYGSLGLIYTFRGQPDKAARWLERARKHWLQSIPLSVSRSCVVPVVLIQANQHLFRPGLTSLPCLVLLTFDSAILANPEYLSDLANKLFSLKNQEFEDPELAYAAEITTNECHIPEKRMRVPARLAGEREVFAVRLDVHRVFLPHGYLIDSDILYCRAEPGTEGQIYHVPPPKHGYEPTV